MSEPIGSRMALTLKFSSQDGRQATVGPLQQAYFQGETLSERPGAPPLAQHVEHSWIVGGQRYSRIDCECRVTLTFCSGDGERIESCGPFEHFSTIDGVAFADRKSAPPWTGSSATGIRWNSAGTGRPCASSRSNSPGGNTSPRRDYFAAAALLQ